jgi:large subunit ribosomal protein L29
MGQKISKLRNMSPEELVQEEAALRDEVWKLRLQRATGALQDPRKVQRTRHDLARVLTVVKEKAVADKAR